MKEIFDIDTGTKRNPSSGMSIDLPPQTRNVTKLLLYLIAFLLAFDQIITYGVAANFGRGGGIGVLLIIVASMALLKLSFPRGSGLSIILFASLLLLQINLAAPIVSQFYVIFIIFSLFTLYSSGFRLYFKNTYIFSVCLIVIAFFNILSKFGFNLFGYVGDLESNRATGLYAEPSHMVYYVTVAYLFAIKEQPRWKRGLGAFSAVLLLANFSLSAIAPLLAIIWTSLISERDKVRNWKIVVIGLFSALCLGLMFVINIDYFAERNIFAQEGEQSATVQVILYYYAMLINMFERNVLIGYGPDQFFTAYSYFADATIPMFGDLNSTDGSFLLVKMVAEFGVILAVAFLFQIFRVLRRYSVPAFVIFLQYVFFRGIGVTSIIPVALLFLAYTSTLSNRMN